GHAQPRQALRAGQVRRVELVGAGVALHRLRPVLPPLADLAQRAERGHELLRVAAGGELAAKHVERSLGSLPVLPLPIQLDQAPGRVEVAPVVPQRLLEVADRPGAVAALEEEAAGLEEARRARTGLRRVGGLLQQVLEITLRVAPL